jgi:sulfite exporter TauE/SafE
MENEKTSQAANQQALNQVSAPSIGLLITGIIGAFFSGIALLSLGIGTSLSSLWMDEMPDKFSEIYEGAFAMGSSFIGLVVAAFVIYASLKMKELTQWGLAVAASILVMIPCISPCCIIGLPIGIWCLLTLNRPEVKNVFH